MRSSDTNGAATEASEGNCEAANETTVAAESPKEAGEAAASNTKSAARRTPSVTSASAAAAPAHHRCAALAIVASAIGCDTAAMGSFSSAASLKRRASN